VKPDYPEWATCERMIWRVHEWCSYRSDPQQKLDYETVATLASDPVYEGTPAAHGIAYDAQAMQKHIGEQMHLFLNLVDEGFIYVGVFAFSG
jgi:hypothetical protein